MKGIVISIDPEDIERYAPADFFVGWAARPSPAIWKEACRNSAHVLLAIDTNTNVICGFCTVLSDSVLSSYIPFVEVAPEYQGRGIGTKLIQKALELSSDLYMCDLTCDSDLVPFYERLGFAQGIAMTIRNYQDQEGHIRI